MPPRFGLLCTLSAIALAVGCTATHVTPSLPSSLPASALHLAPAPTERPDVYVANAGDERVLEFPLGANGDVPPIRTIGGVDTRIAGLTSFGVDAAHLLYVPLKPAGGYETRIGVFTPNQNGDAHPVRIITDDDAGHRPLMLTADSTGITYVLYQDPKQNEGIDEFAAGADGIVSPEHEIAGPNTQLNGAQSISGFYVDPTGAIWWSCDGTIGTPRVSGYAPGAHGDATPAVDLEGAMTLLEAPSALATDAQGYLYIETPFDTDKVGVLVFAPGATGDVAPIRNIRFEGNYALGAIYASTLVATGVIGTDQDAVGTFDAHKSGLQPAKDVITGTKARLDMPVYTVIR
jgi:hypothetical protein